MQLISTSSVVKTKNVFRKYQMSPGGLTCIPTKALRTTNLDNEKVLSLSQPTIWLGYIYMPEMSVCIPIYLHLYLSPSIFLALPPSLCHLSLPHSASDSFCFSDRAGKTHQPLLLWFPCPASMTLLWLSVDFCQVCWSVEDVVHPS